MSRVNDEIDRVAAEWAAKATGRNLTPDEEASFASWHAADVRHRGAYARAELILLRLDRLRAIGADIVRAQVTEAPTASEDPLANGLSASMPEKSPNVMASRSWTRRRIVLTGSAAASVAAAGIVGGAVWNSRPEGDFSTAMGETRVVHLTDGSVVTLNTNTKMSVRFNETERRIRLDRGEALFKVAKSKKRPFIVNAFDAEVRAVGTSFTVQFLPERPIQVLVQEGVVEVKRRDTPDAKPVRAVAQTRTLVPLAAPIMVHAVPRPEVARDLAWRFGQIAFENERLADAAVEFSRYSSTRIVVDPEVADRTITGLFASNDPVGFAKVVASILDLHVKVESEEIRIAR